MKERGVIMSAHQIIYTSCMRGINGVNDGQQIFSYDTDFNKVNCEDIKSLFSYQAPALEAGVIMTEEIATTLPRSFTYRKLENGKCALSLSTYLGRDYMGSAGRFGNHLSHVIVADESDLANYPCEYYGSILLRDKMEFEEVNNPNQPDYLPTPVLRVGDIVSVQKVVEFLGVEDRLEIYKNMLHAMLSFEEHRKRVVILDSEEHIIMWIAALEYALPLENIWNINFTTYEFDPSLSASQICGVVKNGTKFNLESKHFHFIFDLDNNECVTFEKDSDFYDFIDIVFSLSFDILKAFHSFLTDGYSYDKADLEMYDGYALYSLLSDGIDGITRKRLKAALSFANRYAKRLEKERIVKYFFSQQHELIEIDKETFLFIMNYIFAAQITLNIQEQSAIKDIMVDRILREFLKEEATEKEFDQFYKSIDTLCHQSRFNLLTEIMHDVNREKLFAVIQRGVCSWKIALIIKIVSNYVKDSKILLNELIPVEGLGKTYYEIISAVYAQNSESGFHVVKCILNEFSNDPTHLTEMALNVEGMLLDLSGGEKEVPVMWKYYGRMMSLSQKDKFVMGYKILQQYERYEQIFMLYELEIQNTLSCNESQKVFKEHFNSMVMRFKNYSDQYASKVIMSYYSRLSKHDEEQSRNAKIELFDLLVHNEIDIHFVDELISGLLRKVPFKSPSQQDSFLIQSAVRYVHNVQQKAVNGKLLLLWIGMVTEKIGTCAQYKDNMIRLEMMLQSEKANLVKLSEKSIENYFNWVLPKICDICKKNEDMNRFYDLFDMSTMVETKYFHECTKVYFRQSKEHKNYSVFVEYLEFLCAHSNDHIIKDTGEALCKMSKNKLDELDRMIERTWDRCYIQCWEDIKAIAESTNPLLSNISNLFKRRKKED